MLTLHEQHTARAISAIAFLPSNIPDAPTPFAVAILQPLVMASLSLPAPEAEVEVERYRGWPIVWESGFGFAAQMSCHADDCLGWCDTIEEIRAEIDAEVEDRRRSYGAHFHEDTPSLDDTFYRIEMEV